MVSKRADITNMEDLNSPRRGRLVPPNAPRVPALDLPEHPDSGHTDSSDYCGCSKGTFYEERDKLQLQK